MGERDNAAVFTRDKIVAADANIRDVNEQIAKHMLSQKAGAEELLKVTHARAALEKTVKIELEAQKEALNKIQGSSAHDMVARIERAQASGTGGAFAEQDKQKAKKDEVQSALSTIDAKFESTMRKDGEAGRVLATAEAVAEKKKLYQSEADKFIEEQQRMTKAAEAEAAKRMGGSASPLVGLNEGMHFSGVQTSGFAAFGDNFGKSMLGKDKSAFSTYKNAQVPGYQKDTFHKAQSFEPGGHAAPSTTTNTLNVNGVKGEMTHEMVELMRKVINDTFRDENFKHGPSPAPAHTH